MSAQSTDLLKIENLPLKEGGTASSYAIVLAGHGSRDSDGVREFEELVQVLRESAGDRSVYHGFLEFAQPNIAQAVEQAIADGAKCIVVVPALLAAATHAKNDMPGELTELKQRHPQIEFHFGASMDLHPLLLRLCQQRIVEAEAMSSDYVMRSDSCLVVVGRGTSDPDANADISKLARMLEEGMGFGASVVCYSGTAKPLVKEGLLTAAKLGHRRVVVLPYLLFNGVLVKRVQSATESLQIRFPNLEVLTAHHLGVEPEIAKVFLERAQEGIEGRANMNCSLCKYRVQIVGFENQVGTPQQAHHLKARAGDSDQVIKADVSFKAYEPHPIEKESFAIIEAARNWDGFAPPERDVVLRLIHTSGMLDLAEDLFFSPGAVETGVRALLRCRAVITDVTMVDSGIKRSLKEQLGIRSWCGVHDRETMLLSEATSLTRSAAAIRRGYEIFGNDVVLAIGDAPTALREALRLVQEQRWRPQLIIGLPVGFVGTQEAKDELRRCLHVPRITNRGTLGGSPWAAAVVNALMIQAVNSLADSLVKTAG